MSIIGHDLSLITLTIFETFCAFIAGPLSLDAPINAEVSFSQFSVLLMQDITFIIAEIKSLFRFSKGEFGPDVSG